MNMEDVKKYQAEKDHLMSNEGTHPANERRYRSNAEQVAHELGEAMKKEFGDQIEVKEGNRS